MGFDAPELLPLAHGLRPRSQDRDDDGPGMQSHGWQHDASEPRSAAVDGALARARQRKEATYPELRFGRCCLVVLACEVGGRWSEECQDFLPQLAKAKVRSLPKATRSRARQAWLWRACSAAQREPFVLSLLERRVALGSDGPTPSSAEVEVDASTCLSPVE